MLSVRTPTPTEGVHPVNTESELQIRSLDEPTGKLKGYNPDEETGGFVYSHGYEMDAEPEYQGHIVEPLILEWQRHKAAMDDASNQLTRKRLGFKRRIQYNTVSETSRKRMTELEDRILRYTVRLVEVCFHRSSLRHNTCIDLSDIVQECQQKVVDDLLKVFKPIGEDGEVRKFYSLAYISLTRHMKAYERKLRSYHSRHTLIGHNTAAPSSSDDHPAFRATTMSSMESVWNKQTGDRLAAIVLRLLKIRSKLMVYFDYCGASQDVVDFHFRFLIKYGEVPMKKHYTFHFGSLVRSEIRDAVSGTCIVETRIAFQQYYQVDAAPISSWD